MNKTPESAPINVLLMLKDHLAGRYRELHAELAKLRTREQDVREELSRIERHAAIESVPLPTHERTPDPTPLPDVVDGGSK